MPTFKVINKFSCENKGEFLSFGMAESHVEVMCMDTGDDADHEIHCDDGRTWVWVHGVDASFVDVRRETTDETD
jgi:hypothetical protein